MRKLISDTDRMRFRPVDAPRPSSPTLGRDDHVISASPECKSSGSTPLISLISLDSTRTSDKDLIDLSNLQGSRKPGVYDRFIFGLFGDDDPEDDKTNENGDVLLQVPSGPTDIYIPLQNNPPNPAHLVPEGIAQEFHNSLVSMQLQATGKAISTRVWLRCATWWLLKVSYLPPFERNTEMS